MSQKQLVRRSQSMKNQQNKKQEQKPISQQNQSSSIILDVLQPRIILQSQHQQQLSKFYKPNNVKCCGYFSNKYTQEQVLRKKNLQKFIGSSRSTEVQLMTFDGAYVESMNVDTNSDEIQRQRLRHYRDGREEFFYDNGQLLIQKQFFQQQLSRLANISYEQNHSIRTFHKNAILSQRNNQKKNISFQLLINFGDIWFTHHPLQNEQQKKFQQIRPLIKEWYQYSTYPTLPEIKKQIDYLQDLKYQRQQKNNNGKIDKDKVIAELQSKLQACQEIYNKQRQKVEELMKKIVEGWKDVKDIRREKGMETVPKKVWVKRVQCENGKTSYDISVSQCEKKIYQTAKKEDQENQLRRQELIKSQRYYLKVYINGYQVAKTNKFNLSWPSFKVSINQQVNITVYSAPYRINIQLIKSGFIDQVIDFVNIGLPGVNSKTISASQKKLSYTNFSAGNNKQPKPPIGMIFYSIQWQGQGSRMPPSIMIKSSEQQTACTEDSQTDVTEKKQQLQELFDIRDPRYQHKAIKLRVKNQIQEKNNVLPFCQIYSTRLLLLKMRYRTNDLTGKTIPLLQQQVRKNAKLLEIIQKQKNKNQYSESTNKITYFHPSVSDFFNQQKQSILNDIKNLLLQIQNFRVALNRSTTSLKYKVVQQVIEQHIFEQMQSPIVIFFKNIFTQKRKLGPKTVYKIQPRINDDSQIQISFHIRSARNMPIRESSSKNIEEFLQQQNRFNKLSVQAMGSLTLNFGIGNIRESLWKALAPDNMMNYQQNLGNQQNIGYSQNRGYQQNMAPYYNQQHSMNMAGHMFHQVNPNNPNRSNQQRRNILERVNSKVELRFKNKNRQTQVFEGPYPEWNQTLNFKYNIKAEDSTIEKIYYNNQRLIKLIVFDQIQRAKPTLELSQAKIKKRRFYLGRIEVPFSLITVMPTVNGIFKIDRPLIFFSYTVKKQGILEVQSKQPSNSSVNLISNPLLNNSDNLDIGTYVNLDMFVQPHVDTFISLNNDRKFMPGAENILILQKASDWLQQLNTKRYVKLWLNNLDQKSIFICRFLSDNICPPQFSSPNIHLIQRCAKFVSLIPRKTNCRLLQNTEEFHLRVDQMLKLKMGQDHAILLCNYFNNIDKLTKRQSYLVLGKAFPYGNTMFVLRRDIITNDCEIWDPFKGESYYFPGFQQETNCFCIHYKKKRDNNNISVQKDICPMIQVTCIVSKNNVYVNQQHDTNPYLIDFDLENMANWKPFMTQRTRIQYFEAGNIPTYQPIITEQFYKQYQLNQKISQKMATQISTQLSNFIKQKLRQKRKKHSSSYPSDFHKKIDSKLHNSQLLDKCQQLKNDYRLTGKQSPFYETNQVSYKQLLKAIESQKQRLKNAVEIDKHFFGFTLHFPFTTKQQIWEKIQDTNIHLQENLNSQFALKVKCCDYPCNMFSVWVFIGIVD